MKKPVLVLGGGIAGIQASTDLADMGVPVFLVESGPSIGGRMAALDKTFPTNDCSACILAPKVTSCFNHPLVKTFTLSDLTGLEGAAPNFRAVISRRPRYVDEDVCKGCDDCAKVCPIKVKSEFDMGMGERAAIYKPFAQAVPNKAVIDKKGASPCKFNCPAKLDAHGYVALIAEGRYEDALKVVRRTTPFSGVLGRVCFHPCENACARQYVEAPVSIASLKRFIADREASSGEKPKPPDGMPPRDDKIAIIGAGPAGLNCAYRLLLNGYRPVVFEALGEPGGMLRYGIPDFRLDKAVLRREIGMITDMGAEIRTGLSFGSDFTVESLKSEGYRAIFVATGACVDMKLGIPGENHKRVIAGIDFLRSVNSGERPRLGGKAAVVGGGNVAIDAARACVRLGCETTLVYRRTVAEMPANEWEVRHALDEGVAILELASPKEAVTDSGGRLMGLVCVKNELGRPDASGRRRPVPVEGSDFMIEADTVIVAAGQKVDSDAAARGGLGNFGRSGNIRTDETLNAGIEGVFAGGDAARGPATAIEAIADGNGAAEAIINYLEGRTGDVKPFSLPQTPLEDIDTGSERAVPRAAMPMIEMERRTASFDEVETGYDESTALAEARRCLDCSVCCECRMCEEACSPDAIRHRQREDVFELDVSAVILAGGYGTGHELPPELGYGRYADVVTSLEYERILSASGPFAGHIQRPSDGKRPERIAFIQCAGSRDVQCGAPYCSAVCCMYAAKEASITREHLPGVKAVDIFYMEMRAYGKDFDRYITAARDKYGVNFIRSRVGGVTRDESSGELSVSYCLGEGVSSGGYDMVVLSVGMKPDERNRALYARIGVRTDIHGFVWTDDPGAPMSSREGVLACGAAAGPKDIPETVVEASAAAAEGARFAGMADIDIYGPVYGRFFKEIPAVPERDVSRDPIRVGVFVCHCGANIGGYLAVREVVEHARTLPFVSFADESLFTCSIDAQRAIAERIAEYGLNRVVVASCTPRTHEPLFRGVLSSAGLNPYLFTMANIRDQCSWVHMGDSASATEKAKELVTMAIAHAVGAKQLVRKKIPVDRSALVIGGGVSGMASALELSGMGYRVHLTERGQELGGHARYLSYDRAGRPVSPRIDGMIRSVLDDRNIEIHMSSIISAIDGYVGNFKTTLETERGREEFSHGAVIVAVGADESIPDGFGRGSGAVMTHLELERRLRGPDFSPTPGRVAMIQCVGSRGEERPYCSRVCCAQALRNAIRIRLKYPASDVVILFREMRSYGVGEALYTEARKLGVQFVRFADGDYPSVKTVGTRVSVRAKDVVLGSEVVFEADILSLAAAMQPNMEENTRLARMLKVPLNQDGFFLEAHAKLRPVDFATEGVYVAGLAHSPKGFRECMVQGRAAAARAATVLSRDFLETEGAIARVDASLCSACGACADVCAYGAVSVEDVAVRRGTVKKAVVNEVLCKGCGTCGAVCRCGAIDISGFSDAQVINELEYLLRGAPCGCV